MEITPGVQIAWQLGAQETLAAQKAEIGPIQFFCGLTKLADLTANGTDLGALVPGLDIRRLTDEIGAALSGLRATKVNLTDLRRALRRHAGTGQHGHRADDVLHRSDTLRDLFRQAERFADDENRSVVVLADIVNAMLSNTQLVVTRSLIDRGLDPESLRPAAAPGASHGNAAGAGGTPTLDRYGRDLTALARADRLGPVIGRRDEVLQVLRTLMRRSKNNPVLVGEPGVGKTAIAELLAIRLAEGKHADVLGPRRIVELSMSSLIAGAKLLGEREERLEALVQECRENPEVLLFIDELHTLVTAGGHPGTIDPKDVFKPALARGEIRCIGATTLAEYQRYIESDPALERRFDRIVVVEPSAEEALEILERLAPTMQTHHGVEIPREALEAAIELSVAYDVEHQLPDKAIDLVDKAAAMVRVPTLSVIAESGRKKPPPHAHVTRADVSHALAQKLGLPIETLAAVSADEGLDASLADLERKLNDRVLGQEHAAKSVAERLVTARAGLLHRHGPRAVFLFLGSTGTGKTEMASSLAEFLYGDRHGLIRLDMSELTEEHDVVKLVGAPPGYIGHDEPGQLTGPLRSRPYAVVLLDEIDKAHPRALDLLLQVFDAGRITDAKGRTVDARHAIFVLTSNVPGEASHRVGFLTSSADVGIRDEPELGALKARFRPEFMNRIDATIVFRPLAAEHVHTLARRYVAETQHALSARFGKTLSVPDAVIEWLAARGQSDEYGVRELKRTIEQVLDAPLSKLVFSGRAADWRGIQVTLDGEKLRFEPDPAGQG